MSNTTTATNRVGVWYPVEDVKATFEELNRFYPGYLRSLHRRGDMSTETAIQRHSIFQLAQELVLHLSDSGTLAEDFKAWLVWKRNVKLKEVQAKDIAKARDILHHIMGEDSITAADILDWLNERHAAQSQRWEQRLKEQENHQAAVAA